MHFVYPYFDLSFSYLERSGKSSSFFVCVVNIFSSSHLPFDFSKVFFSLEGMMLKLKLQYFGHQMQRTDSLEKTLMLGKIDGRRRRGG